MSPSRNTVKALYLQKIMNVEIIKNMYKRVETTLCVKSWIFFSTSIGT